MSLVDITGKYHFCSARHGVFRNRVHLVLGLHLPAPLLIFTHLHQHDTEVCPPQIQGQEVAHLCRKTHTSSECWLYILYNVEPFLTKIKVL